MKQVTARPKSECRVGRKTPETSIVAREQQHSLSKDSTAFSPAGSQTVPDAAQTEREGRGLALLVDILKHKRISRRLALATVARRVRVPVSGVERMDAYDLRSVGLPDLLAIATALGSKLAVEIVPRVTCSIRCTPVPGVC